MNISENYGLDRSGFDRAQEASVYHRDMCEGIMLIRAHDPWNFTCQNREARAQDDIYL